MGMYTAFHFNSKLVNDVPEDVIVLLKQMVSYSEVKIPKSHLLNHKLFNNDFENDVIDRWKYMLKCDSTYFDEDTYSYIKYDSSIYHFNNKKIYNICIRCNLKNYNNEIELFVDWITPYLDKSDGEFLGFMRYEETQIPTLIYYPNMFIHPYQSQQELELLKQDTNQQEQTD